MKDKLRNIAIDHMLQGTTGKEADILCNDRTIAEYIENDEDLRYREKIVRLMEQSQTNITEFISIAIADYQDLERTGIHHNMTLAEYIVQDLIDGINKKFGEAK